jgi:two-component system, OmpR family, sensor histidine kinase BaeS
VSSPLAAVGSIKVKLGLLVVASVVVAMVVSIVGYDSGVPLLLAFPVTVALALGVTQLLAVGMTSPLREMTEAARRMATGDYRGRVRAETSDEVGELARAFNQMATELDTVDREQRALVATVSHELRTPLAGLTAVLENLADGVVPADEHHLDAAVGQARRLSDLVGDLLELSRVDAGVAPLRLSEVDVATFLDEVVADLVPTGRAVSFSVEVDDGMTVCADRARLRQLVVNLLDNAVRHGPERGIVRVGAEQRGDRWVLAISDEGPGVPPADRERAFERFGTLADDPSSAAAGATGLGLAIARWVATLHSGTVRFVDPPIGKTGAVLHVDLPLDPPERQVTRPAVVPAEVADTSRHGTDAAMKADVPSAPPVPTVTHAVAPVIDPLFDKQWPDAVRSGRPVVLAAVVVGFLGGALLPEHDLGLAFFIVLVAAGATVWWAAEHRRDPFTVTCLALAALCTLPVVLLDAEWIAVLCVLAGAAATVAGVTRGRRLLEFVVAGIAWPLSGIRGLPWLGRSLRGVLGTGRVPRVAATAAWSLLAVLVFGLLFVSADAVMADWVDTLLPDLTIESFVLRCFVGVFVGGTTLAAAYLALNPPNVSAVPGARATATAHRFEWLVPVLLVDAVFAMFVAAQATVLFGGHGYVQRTTGLTYADYVHQGFGQLTIATLLMFIVVWGASQRVGRDRADRLWMRISLGLLCALTLVVVVSALHRMHLYQEAYGFTQERLLADVFEGWLGVVVIAVAVAGIAPWRRWVPRFALVTGVLGLLGLAAINPDAWIARHNIDRYEQTGKLDIGYLASLSYDALPTVLTLPEPLRMCALSLQSSEFEDDAALEWNLGRARARDAADDKTYIDTVGACPPGLALD